MTLRSQSVRILRGVARRIDNEPRTAAPTVTKLDRFIGTSTSAPGSRVPSNFFDDYPRFFETSQTSAFRDRLNLRYEAIFAENREIFDGASVLDIASHDGRWSLAALATGAASVVGIEAKEDLVQHARATLADYGYGADRATFVAGDVYDVFAEHSFDVDVVLCLGYLYHTLRFNELLHGIRSARPRHVVIDTQSQDMTGKHPVVYLARETISREGNAVPDKFSHGQFVLSGRPNITAVRTMMAAYGYEQVAVSDWAGLVRDNPAASGVDDYADQRRSTILFRAD